jgi:hypothetical protein
MVGFILITFASVTGCSQTTHTSLGYGVPSQVQWNGRTYGTEGWIKTVGTQLGFTQKPGKVKVFRVPGHKPNDEIALEYDYPNGKYIKAKIQNK